MRRRLLALIALLAALGALNAGGVHDSFALVLSGGGGRAFAQIPVLEELDRRGIVPDLVVGSGTGALIGGLYAAGYTGEEIEEMFSGDILQNLVYSIDLEAPGRSVTGFLDYDADIATFSLGDMEWSGSGLVDDQYLTAFLERSFAKVSGTDDFNWLPIAFRATAADVQNNSLVVFDKGSLAGAVRASMSTPLLFAPVDLGDGRVVMDGGIASNLPVEAARALYSNTILAVDVNDSLEVLRKKEPEMTTLDGALNALNEYMTSYGIEESYDKADWVIVTDTSSYPMLDFKATEEILQKGREAVEAATEVFDELEERYGGRERVLYRDLEPGTVKEVRAEGLPSSALSGLRRFEGAALDEATLLLFEEELSVIKEREKLKRVTYRIEDGALLVTGEPYPAVPGEISLGFHGTLGLFYGGGVPYLGYYPEFIAEGYVAVLPGLEADFGAQVDEGAKGYAGLTYHFSPKTSLFGFLEIRYGGLFWTSVMGYEDYDFSNSLGARAAAGASLEYGTLMRLEAILGFDYSWVAANSTDGMGSIYDAYLYIGLGFTFNGYDGRATTDTGFDAELTVKFGGDFPDPAIGYELSFSFTAVGSPSEYLRFVLEGEAVSLRRPAEYSSAWAISKTGKLSPDYVYLMGGVLIPLPASFYISAGIFLEAMSSEASSFQTPYSWSMSDLIPFSTLDYDGIGLGGTLSFGIQLSFGKIGMELYMSDSARITLMVGLE